MENPLVGIQDSLSKYIVRPFNQFGLGGFVFDVEEDATVTLQNDITDHFTEDNTTINDQIAIKPKRVVLKNYIGELTDIVEGEIEREIQKLTQKLTILSNLLPQITAATEQAQEGIDEIKKTGNLGLGAKTALEQSDSFVDLFALTKNLLPPVTKQEQTYMYLKSLRDQKILVGLQTPFEFMPNMAIETIVAKQDGTTRFMSDFTITLKEIRFAKVIEGVLSDADKSRLQKEIKDQAKIAGTTPKGSVICEVISAGGKQKCEARNVTN